MVDMATQSRRLIAQRLIDAIALALPAAVPMTTYNIDNGTITITLTPNEADDLATHIRDHAEST